MKRIGLTILCFTMLLSCKIIGQVTFIVDELPENHDYNKSIYISGDFEGWSGGKDQYKLTQLNKQYSITLHNVDCSMMFKFTLGSWSTVETNLDGSALDNRVFKCNGKDEVVNISVESWSTPGGIVEIKSTAKDNVQILTEEFKIPQLDRVRKVWMYLPPDYYASTERYPVLYMHDAQNIFDETTSYAGEWNVDETLNRLFNDIGFKLIVVGIDNGGEKRINEYSPWDNANYGKGEGMAYTEFIAKTLKPHIDKSFRTLPDAANTGMMGSSLGGLITHYAALKYPTIFGKLGVFSPSFWYADQSYEFAKQQSASADMKMYFLAGELESETMVPNMDRMIDKMKNSGFKPQNIQRKVVLNGKHNEKLWREGFEESILWLYGLDKPHLGNPDRLFEGLLQTENGLEVQVNDGMFLVTFYSDEIVETTFIPNGQEYKEESHAVVLEPSKVELNITSKENSHNITSNGIDITIHHNPFQISYWYKGNPITSEKKGYHKTDYGEAIQLNVTQGEALYGGGSRALGMNRRGNRLQLYNKAHFGYEDRSPLMNYTMPIVISSNKYMVHFDNAPIGYLDLDSKMDNTITYETISGRKTYQVIVGDTWEDLIDNYTDLTGKQPLPPRWTFGNFSSRFGYHSQEEVKQTITKFKEDEIPVDALILDVFWFGKDIQGHMGNLEFLKDSFPEPLKMIKNLKGNGVKTILITEPFVLTTSSKWQEAVDKNVLATDSLGNPFTFDFYFGNTGLIDVYNPKGRHWFWNEYKKITNMGVEGVWGDLGEPEVHPTKLRHHKGTADEVHNIYGHDWAKLVYEGYAKDFPSKRPFILMRAGYSGSQRYGLIPWSGDVNRTWGGLHPQVEIALQMGMQGLGYMHSDLGGFGGDNLDDELYTRWLQYGVFQPLFRPHAQEVVPSEPVYRSQKAKELAKRAIELRYRMLPYNYQLAFENNQKGISFMRPLFYEDNNEDLLNNSTSFLWGKDFLVTPLIDAAVQQQKVYFPSGSIWFDFYTDEKYIGGETKEVETQEEYIPTYVRAGAFIPLTKLIQTTDDYEFNDFELHYYHDTSVTESGRSFYNDDGKTKNAFEKGQYEILEFEANLENTTLKIGFEAEIGRNYTGQKKDVNLNVHNLPVAPISIEVDGRNLKKFSFNTINKTLSIPVKWNSIEDLEIKIKLKK